MIIMGAFEAKTHFSQMLVKVTAGEEVMITRHGKEVARLVPVVQPKEPALEAIEMIHRLRRGVRLGKDLTLKQLIEEGRA